MKLQLFSCADCLFVPALGQFGQVMPDIARAKGAAAIIFETIDRVPMIDPKEGSGVCVGPKKSRKIRGKIAFSSVNFAYPQRPDTKIMSKFNLEIKPGKTIALGSKLAAAGVCSPKLTVRCAP